MQVSPQRSKRISLVVMCSTTRDMLIVSPVKYPPCFSPNTERRQQRRKHIFLKQQSESVVIYEASDVVYDSFSLLLGKDILSRRKYKSYVKWRKSKVFEIITKHINFLLLWLQYANLSEDLVQLKWHFYTKPIFLLLFSFCFLSWKLSFSVQWLLFLCKEIKNRLCLNLLRYLVLYCITQNLVSKTSNLASQERIVSMVCLKKMFWNEVMGF